MVETTISINIKGILMDILFLHKPLNALDAIHMNYMIIIQTKGGRVVQVLNQKCIVI